MREVIAHDGETLDALLWRILRRTDIAPQVLEANPQLARLSAILPAGTKVVIPELPAPAAIDFVRLWG